MEETLIQAPRTWRCIRYIKRLEGSGATRPMLCQAVDNSSGERIDVVLKVRVPDSRHGHYGPTSLAAELICAMLAQALSLPVPEYGIISIDPALAEVIDDQGIARIFRENAGKNFATKYHPSFAVLEPFFETQNKALRDLLEDVMAYDASVFNCDRMSFNPNILWRGSSLLIIDHSLALPVCRWSEEELESSPLVDDSQLQEHVSRWALRGQKRFFDRIIERWTELFSGRDFEDIVDMIPEEWETRPGDLSKMLRFLKDRSGRFVEIQHGLKRAVMKMEA